MLKSSSASLAVSLAEFHQLLTKGLPSDFLGSLSGSEIDRAHLNTGMLRVIKDQDVLHKCQFTHISRHPSSGQHRRAYSRQPQLLE